jgi:hypothetical protein
VQPLSRLNSSLGQVYTVLNNADAQPTIQAAAAAHDVQQTLAATMAAWNRFKTEELPKLNQQLQQANQKPLNLRALAVQSIENPYEEGEEP